MAQYRANWQTAIDEGKACSVEPGDEIELPDMPWPPIRRPQQDRIDNVADESSTEHDIMVAYAAFSPWSWT